uniref:Uncharacterized protein n=1 Tax=Glossina brevipalpis TaxID=37001 RepID=A0A1A9WXM8_9MUSC
MASPFLSERRSSSTRGYHSQRLQSKAIRNDFYREKGPRIQNPIKYNYSKYITLITESLKFLKKDGFEISVLLLFAVVKFWFWTPAAGFLLRKNGDSRPPFVCYWNSADETFRQLLLSLFKLIKNVMRIVKLIK